MTRFLAPSFLVPAAPCLLAVDRVQPVAATVSADGEVLDVVSWAQEVPPPAEAVYPNRRIGIGDGRVVVQDLPAGDPVTLTIGAGGSVTKARAADSASLWDGLRVRHTRGSSQAGGKYGEWQLRTRLYYGNRWATQVERHADGVVSVWRAGHGTFVAHAMAGDVLAVCVRRADKRPWTFDPAHELYLLRARGPGIATPIEVGPIDVTDLCWDRGERPPDGFRGMQTYLTFSTGQAEEVRRLGATDVRLVVRDLDTWPVIELSFDLPDVPGVRFVERDEPFDELGNLSGLRFLNRCFAGTSVETLTAGTVAVDGRIDL